MFIKEMSELCESHTSLRHSGMEFVQLVDELMNYLLEYRREKLLSEQDEGKTNQMMCIFNLLEFYQRELPDQEEVYVKYVLLLYNLHKESDNWAEAGYTLLR